MKKKFQKKFLKRFYFAFDSYEKFFYYFFNFSNEKELQISSKLDFRKNPEIFRS